MFRGAGVNVFLAVSMLLAMGFVGEAQCAEPARAPRDGVIKAVAESARANPKLKPLLYVEAVGVSKMKAVKADEKGLTLLVEETEMPVGWEMVKSDREFLAVAREYLKDSAAGRLELARFCMAAGMIDEAEKEATGALDAKPGAELEAAAKGVLDEVALRRGGAPVPAAPPSGAAPGEEKKMDRSGLYVSKVQGPKPYPEGRPWQWSDLASQATESRDRKDSPWLKPAEGAKHPVVLFDPDEVSKIRERLTRGAGPRIMVHLKNGAEKGIADAGLYSLLTDDPSYAKKAIPKLIASATRPPGGSALGNGRQLQDVALGYDLLYNYMTVEERDKVRGGLDRCAQSMFLYRVGHTNGNWLGNNQAALGLAGLALREEDRYAESWILRAKQAVVLYMHNTFDPEGADFEALSRYLAMGIDPILIFCAAERRQGRDYFTYRNNVFNGIVEFMAYMLAPSRRAWVPFDDAFVKDVDCVATIAALAGILKDPLAQGIFESVYAPPKTWVGDGVLAAVFYDPDLAPESPQTSKRLSLARAYWGIPGEHEGEWSSGHVFMRTGFDSAEDILFAAQCGDTGGWHGHADQSGFYLAAYGEVLALDPALEGSYGDPLAEWMKGAECHNVVLVDGETSPPYTVGDRANWPERFYHAGSIDGFIHTETLDFVSMDFAEALALNPKVGKAERAKRYVVFMRHPDRQGYFVIVDDVAKDNSPRKYEWLLQPDGKHKAQKDGPGRFSFAGNVELDIRMIEPKDPDHRLATFKGYGVQYLRISSKEPRARGLFFTILYPRKKDAAIPEIAEIREGDVIGAKIGEDVVLFNAQKSGATAAGDVKSDGELVALRIDGGAAVGAVVVGGGSLSYKGGAVKFEKPGHRKLE